MIFVPRAVAVFASPTSDAESTIREAATAQSLEVRVFHRPGEWMRSVEQEPPLAALIHLGAAGAFELLSATRAEPRYGSLPIVGLTREVTDLAFSRLFECGGDDLVAAHATRPIRRRLGALALSPKHAARDKAPAQVLVASASQRWRGAMSRVLANVGIEACCVSGSSEVLEAVKRSTWKFVVATEDLEPTDAIAAAYAARRAGCESPWVIATARRHASAAMTAASRALPKIAFLDVFGPPENVLFVANALASSWREEQRASRRVLFGAPVAFRVAGAREDDIGFTYDVSADGLFVRTLAPLDPDDKVWIELVPPLESSAVRLGGRVVWKRRFDPSDDATAPPGFGVELVDGMPGDLALWKAGYRALTQAPLGEYEQRIALGSSSAVERPS